MVRRSMLGVIFARDVLLEGCVEDRYLNLLSR